ncbi:hypothetical protein GDO81_023589 [Engystomops pustulosus]|uniref:Olfactory receptor n=1 Tax=Engystomops pustulosus TaxID=76066 RepID=A0AAV6ZNN1_ENGPU|nr:hypothetical protein GDO81_023589 [Engystomops pustulosus]
MEFILLGFRGSPQRRILIFCLIFVVFCFTIFGNLLIVFLVSINKSLQTPMYFFISQLSISDISLASDIVPNMLHLLLNNGGAITYIGCMAQFNFLCATEATECLLLTVMTYDRYVAICNPLRYTSIMTTAYWVRLSVGSWLISLCNGLANTLAVSRLKICGSNVIDHVFCDLVPLEELACSDTFPIKLQMFLLSIPFLITPSIIIVISYVKIIRAILRIPTNISRRKAFSTCSSHLIVVSIFYWTIFSVYILPTKGNAEVNKSLSLLYTVFTPLINPIIYSFKNTDIKKAAEKVFPNRKGICKSSNC